MTRRRWLQITALGPTQRLTSGWRLPDGFDLAKWSVQLELLPGVKVEITYEEWQDDAK